MIGFAVIGRPFDPDIFADGYVRNEPAILLRQLAMRRRGRTWAVLGKPTVGDWSYMPNNVSVFPPETSMSTIVVWLAGGFAAMRQDTPRLDGTPQEYRRTLAVYVQPIADILRAHRGKTVWIVNDPRSYFRARDVPKPDEILCQHNFEKEGVRYFAAGTDLAAMPWFDVFDPEEKVFDDHSSMQVVASTAGKHGRVEALERWNCENRYPFSQLQYEQWLRASQDTVLFPPSSRSPWITAKFWECAANGVIPWLAEGYDEQNISGINDIGLGWLRVDSPQELQRKRRDLFDHPNILARTRSKLRLLYENRMQSHQLLNEIEGRLGS